MDTISPLTLTQAEVDEIKALIADGKAPVNYFELHAQAAAENVFGVGFKRDDKCRPIENGIGSPGHETVNHWNALRAAERAGLEPPGTTDRLMAEAARKKKASTP